MNAVQIIVLVLLSASALLYLIAAFVLFRDRIVSKNHKLIFDAIYFWHLDQIDKGLALDAVDYSDVEDFESTFNRLWDWGYKRILPPDKFEIIEPYIVKGRDIKIGE